MADTKIEKIVSQFDDFSDQELDLLVKTISKEIADRRTVKIQLLIENFRKAFYAIDGEVFSICVNGEIVDDFSQFEFDY